MRITNWISRQLQTERDWNTVPQNREAHTIVAATATGAAVGAVAGTLYGAAHMDRVETTVAKDIVDPEFKGYTYSRHEDTSQTCIPMGQDQPDICYTTTDGYRHYFTPKYNDRVVGHYDKPSFLNSDSFGALKGAAIGAVGGGLLGLVTGVGINVLRKATMPDLAPAKMDYRTDSDLQLRAPNVIAISTGAGAAVGGLTGLVAGAVEQSRHGMVERTFVGPVTVKTEMGLVPPYRYTGSAVDLSNSPATQPVYRDVPVYGSGGQVQMESKTQEFSTARYGMWSGLAVGSLVGAGVGLAGGIAANVINRMNHYEKDKTTP